MIIANIEKQGSDSTYKVDITAKNDSKYIESDVRIVELDGHIFKVKKVFATEGRTILEGVVSMLLDRMERQEQMQHI